MSGIDINELIRQLDDRLITFYNNEIKPEIDMPLYQYIVSLDINYSDYIEDLSNCRRIAKKARVSARLSWYKRAIRDMEENKTGSIPMKYFNFLLENKSTALTWEDFKIKYTKIVDAWRDNDKLLTEFPFLPVSTLYTKESAFTKELVINIIDLFEAGLNNDGVLFIDRADIKDVSLQPLEFLLGPFVSVNSPGSLLLDKELDSQNRTVIYNDYRVPYSKEHGDFIVRSLITLNDITEQITNARTLSAFDVGVFQYVFNYIFEKIYVTFLQTRKFQNYLVDIVRAVFPNVKKLSATHYAQVRNSLVKLSALNIKGIRNNEVAYVINFFDTYSLELDASGKQVVTLGVGSYMYDRISTRKTQLIYSNEVKLIEDKSAQFIYYLFESERQKAYAAGRIGLPLEYNYTFLLHTMRFPSRATVKANMDLIDDIFESFIKLNVLFVSYERKPKCFIVKFKPFTRDDIISLRLTEPAPLPLS